MLDSLSRDNKTFRFLSQSSENLPPGLKTGFNYEIRDNNKFIDVFELAFPGKDFSEW